MLARCPRCDKPFVDTGDGRCPRCGDEAEEGGQPAGSGARKAGDEKGAVVVEGGADAPRPERPKSGIPAPPARFSEGRPAAEDPQRPLLSRYFGTLADVCLRPVGFFTHLSRAGAPGITWFAYASVLAGTAVGAVWGLLLLPLLHALLGSWAKGVRPEDLAALEGAASESPVARILVDVVEMPERIGPLLALVEAQLWATLLLAPVTAFFTVHLVAGLLHLSAQLFRLPGEERVPYEVTYRFTVYGLAPLALSAIPMVGDFASLFALIVLGIAMARLHRLRAFGVVATLWPVVLLSWMWGQEVLPRVAPQVAAVVGVEVEAPPAAPAAAKPAGGVEDADVDEGALAALPPTPPPDRDHGVEITPDGRFLETSRVFRSSRGPLLIRHRAAPAEDGSGEVLVEVIVVNQGERALGPVAVEIPLPSPDAPGGDDHVVARASELSPGEEKRFEVRGRTLEPRALLQVGPTVILEAPGAAP